MDADLAEPAPVDSNGNLVLDFGTSIQGTEKRIKIYAANTIEFDIQLEPLTDPNEPDLKIVRYPSVLRAGSTEEVIISFKPDLDRISPLQTGWDFRKIILAKNY